MKFFSYMIPLLSILIIINSNVKAQILVESEKPEAVEHSLFGWSTASIYEWAAVGSPQLDVNGILGVGGVTIYNNNDHWTISQEISPDNLPRSANFGISLAFSWETLFVGALNTDSDAPFAGSVYVYEFDSNIWAQTQILTASDSKPGSQFGYSISTEPEYNILVVGAYNADGNESKSGAVYIFQKDYNSEGHPWVQIQKIVAEDGKSHDYFGHSVKLLTNNVLAVGAYNADGAEERSGAVYIFERNQEGMWVQTQKVFDPNGNSSDLFGYSIAREDYVPIIVKENTLQSHYSELIFIGAPGANSENVQSGSVYVFDRAEGDLILQKELFEEETGHNDHFGVSIGSMNGILFVGANRSGFENLGKVYQYEYYQISDNEFNFDNVNYFPTNESEKIDYYGGTISTDMWGGTIMISSPHSSRSNLKNSGDIEFFESLPLSSEDDSEIILDYKLEQNYPNPFNPTTQINYQVKDAGLVKLTVFNLLGQEVQTLVNEQKVNGAYSVDFNASALSSGFYFYRLEVNDFVSVKKMMLIK